MSGFFDVPNFVVKEKLTEDDELYALVGLAETKLIGKYVPEIQKQTAEAISKLPEGKKWMDAAMESYDPNGKDHMGVGFYFDSPGLFPNPRWATGWAVKGVSFDKLKAVAEKLSTKKLTIRAVKLAHGPVIVGRIPWRHAFSARAAPVIHWKRALKTYVGLEVTTPAPKQCQVDDGIVCCEIYVTGKRFMSSYIDYLVLHGNTDELWDAVYPVKKSKSNKKK